MMDKMNNINANNFAAFVAALAALPTAEEAVDKLVEKNPERFGSGILRIKYNNVEKTKIGRIIEEDNPVWIGTTTKLVVDKLSERMYRMEYDEDYEDGDAPQIIRSADRWDEFVYNSIKHPQKYYADDVLFHSYDYNGVEFLEFRMYREKNDKIVRSMEEYLKIHDEIKNKFKSKKVEMKSYYGPYYEANYYTKWIVVKNHPEIVDIIRKNNLSETTFYYRKHNNNNDDEELEVSTDLKRWWKEIGFGGPNKQDSHIEYYEDWDGKIWDICDGKFICITDILKEFKKEVKTEEEGLASDEPAYLDKYHSYDGWAFAGGYHEILYFKNHKLFMKYWWKNYYGPRGSGYIFY